MERWTGKVAVVTGASAGIGAETTKRLVGAGLTVVGVARRLDKVQQLAASLPGGTLYPLKADVSDADDVVEAFGWIRRHVGDVHVLVNNAGVARNTTLIDGDADEWRKVIDTNVLGAATCTREALKSMTAVEQGHIVNVNSILGHAVMDMPAVNVYPASKFALRAYGEALRVELLAEGIDNVRISSVSPGVVRTEIAHAGNYNPTVEYLNKPKLDSGDVADAIIYVLAAPPHVVISEMVVLRVGEKSWT